MKKKKSALVISIVLVVIAVVSVIIIINTKFQANKANLNMEKLDYIEFSKEPEKIRRTIDWSSSLYAIFDGDLYLCYTDKRHIKIDLPFKVFDLTDFGESGGYMLIIDADKNLYSVSESFEGLSNNVQDSVSDILLTDVVDVSVGDNYPYGRSYAAVTGDGKLYVWGNNSYGQLGIGDVDYVDKPMPVDYIDNVEKIKMGSYSFLMTKDGNVYESGYNDENQERLHKFTKISALNDIINIYDSNENIAVDSNGKVYCWKDGFYSRGNYESNKMISDMLVNMKLMLFQKEDLPHSEQEKIRFIIGDLMLLPKLTVLMSLLLLNCLLK